MRAGFNKVWEWRDKIIEMGREPDFQTLLFSDMYLPDSNFKDDLLPENTMFITNQDGAEYVLKNKASSLKKK